MVLDGNAQVSDSVQLRLKDPRSTAERATDHAEGTLILRHSGRLSGVEREMKEMKLRVGEERLLKQLAMQIFNGEGALAPPRALRPPLLRDLFDASGNLGSFVYFQKTMQDAYSYTLHQNRHRSAAS